MQRIERGAFAGLPALVEDDPGEPAVGRAQAALEADVVESAPAVGPAAGRAGARLAAADATRALGRFAARPAAPGEPAAVTRMRELVRRYLALGLEAHAGMARIVTG